MASREVPPEHNGSPSENNVTRSSPSIRDTRFPFMLTTVLAVIVFYGYIFEPNNLPRSAVARMNDLSARTKGENDLMAYFEEVTRQRIKKYY